MKLSIITINYNNAEGLKKTIESVIGQTYTDVEYIVIDGGSTDESINVIAEYENKLAYWISEPDRGIYHAMNKGIAQAKGEYCQFLNSGDWLVNAEIIQKVFTHALPKETIIYGNLLKVFPNGTVLRDRGITDKVTVLSLWRGSINHASSFIPKSLFEKYGLYDESLKIVADWKFYLIAVGLHDQPVKYLNLDVTCFDMSGISTVNTPLSHIERRKVLEMLIPPRILSDYDMYGRDIYKMKRIKKYKLSKCIFWLLDRTLFKVEKAAIRKVKKPPIQV